MEVKFESMIPIGNIIFVTSHSELTYLTFVYKVSAMDFIFKDDPNQLKTRIIDCIETAHTRLKLLSKKVMLRQLN